MCLCVSRSRARLSRVENPLETESCRRTRERVQAHKYTTTEEFSSACVCVYVMVPPQFTRVLPHRTFTSDDERKESQSQLAFAPLDWYMCVCAWHSAPAQRAIIYILLVCILSILFYTRFVCVCVLLYHGEYALSAAHRR